MSGHLFILGQRQITETVVKNKRIQVSAKQFEAGAGEIKADDLIFCGVGRKGGPIILWLTAKAATGFVKEGSSGYVRLSYVKVKNSQSAYPLVEGIAIGQSLKDVHWKKLDDQEASACFFDTALFGRSIVSLRKTLEKSMPKGLGMDADTVLHSILLNGAAGGHGPVLREWYDSELLINEPKYRLVLKKRLAELGGVQFEELLAAFFKQGVFGFSDVRMTPRSHDDGIDLILTRQDDVFGSFLVVGQCKRRKSAISSEEVRSLATVRSHAKAARAIFITTSHFSDPAKNVAIQDGHIELIDGEKLANLFFRHAEKTPGLWGLIRHSVQLTM